MSPEVDTRTQQIVTQAQEQMSRQINDARTGTPTETVANEQRVRGDIEKLLQNLAVDADEVSKAYEKGEDTLTPDQSKKAEKGLAAVAKTFAAVKEGLFKTGPGTNPEAKAAVAIITQVAQRNMNPRVANELLPIVEKALFKDRFISFSQKGEPKTEFERELAFLKDRDPEAARILSESIIEAAKYGDISGLSVELAREKFGSISERVKIIEEELPSSASIKKIDAEIRNLGREQKNWLNMAKSVTSAIPLEARIRRIVTEEVERRRAGESVSPEELKKEIEFLTQSKTSEARGKLSLLIGLSSDSEGAGGINTSAKTAAIQSLLTDGLITSDEFDRLIKLISDGNNIEQNAADLRDGGFNRLVYKAANYGVSMGDKAQFLEILDNPESVIALLKSDEYTLNKGLPNEQINFEKFYQEIKEVAERVLSVVELNRGEFFEQAFNPMYHGQFYKILIQKLRDLGDEIEKKDPEMAKRMVMIEDIALISDPTTKGEGSKPEIAYKNKKKISLKDGISQNIVNRVVKLRDVHEYLHNAEHIVDEGLGFESLAKYAERISTEDMDWFLSEDPEISKAYNFYIQKLKEELFIGGKVVGTSFGKRDITYGLDNIQRKVFLQLLAGRGGEGNKVQIARKVRMASGIAKAYTAEYWGVLMQSTMPISFQKVEVKDKRGNLVKDKDNNPVYRYAFKNTFQGTFDTGYEKMLTSLNPELIWRRFNAPGYYPELPYVFQPRDLHARRYDDFNHAMIYESREMAEDAFFQGASDDYMKFYKKNMTLGDYLKLNVIGTLARGGWRVAEYKAYIKMNEDATQYKLFETLSDLMALGTYPLKTFIDNIELEKLDIKDFHDILKSSLNNDQIKELEEAMAEIKKYPDPETEKGKKAEKNLNKIRGGYLAKFKEVLYKELIFERMFTMSPTKIMGFEDRQYTHRDDKLVVESLTEYLVGQYQSKPATMKINKDNIRKKVMSLFIGSLETAQKIKWDANKDNFVSQSRNVDLNSKEKVSDFRNLITANEFTVKDLNDPAIRQSIKVFFDLFKQDFGTILGTQEGDMNLDFINWEEFIDKTLPGYLTELKNESKTKVKNYKFIHEKEIHEKSWDKGEWETIDRSQQFTNWLLTDKLGILNYRLGGEDLDLSRFYLSVGGKREVARFMGETNAIATKVIPNASKVYDDAARGVTKGHYDNVQKLEEMIANMVGKPINEAAKTLFNQDKTMADEFSIRNTLFFTRMVGKDKGYRRLLIGPLAEDFDRRMWHKQGSFVQDYLVSTIHRPTKSLNSDEIEAVGHTVLSECDVSWDPLKTNVPHKEVGWGPFKTTVPDIEYEVAKKKFLGVIPYWTLEPKKEFQNEWNGHQFLKAENLTALNFVDERLAPILPTVFFLILLVLAKNALEKNKKH